VGCGNVEMRDARSCLIRASCWANAPGGGLSCLVTRCGLAAAACCCLLVCSGSGLLDLLVCSGSGALFWPPLAPPGGPPWPVARGLLPPLVQGTARRSLVPGLKDLKPAK
jgi:hypothetical protein